MQIKRVLAGIAVPVLLVVMSSPVFAARRANGNATSTATCTVADGTVNAAGLPTGEVINFMVTDASGTDGWVLGYSGDGTWAVPVAPADGPTTYEFVSKTWGPNGSKYTVFAGCALPAGSR